VDKEISGTNSSRSTIRKRLIQDREEVPESSPEGPPVVNDKPSRPTKRCRSQQQEKEEEVELRLSLVGLFYGLSSRNYSFSIRRYSY